MARQRPQQERQRPRQEKLRHGSKDPPLQRRVDGNGGGGAKTGACAIVYVRTLGGRTVAEFRDCLGEEFLVKRGAKAAANTMNDVNGLAGGLGRPERVYVSLDDDPTVGRYAADRSDGEEKESDTTTPSKPSMH